MTTTSQKIYPGLICDSVEMFQDGGQLLTITNGTVKPFRELSFYYIQIIREAIQKDQSANYELHRMHPDSEMKRVEQFAICNFSGLDYVPDIQNGVLQEGEYWACPKRGHCPGEGKICKSLKYNGKALSPVEINIIKLLTTDITNEAMASDLLLPFGTFHLVKKKLYEKLGVATKQEITIIALQLNII